MATKPTRQTAAAPASPPGRVAQAAETVVSSAAPPSLPAELIPASLLSPWRGSSKVTRINLPTPRIGGKAWLLNRKGLFVLEEGYGVLRTIACTHIGSGSMMVVNGLPNKYGEIERFPPEFPPGEEGEWNGRPLYRANPNIMGSWMMDAGFTYGLTVYAEGGTDNNCCIATIVWLPAPPPRDKT